MPPSVDVLATAWKKATPEVGLGWRAQLAALCLATLLVFSHRPDAVRNAQFYAEDGVIWFAQAHNSGWLHSLVLPQNGYFQTLPRLAAGLGLLVPLRWAPMAMNLVGITVQVLPVFLLLSTRLSYWAPFSLRAVWALAYIVLPNVMELEATITDGQWHLVLVACLVLLAGVPGTLWWWLFDIAIISISGLSGPFCLLLLPVGLTYWCVRRERWRIVPIVLVSLASLVQLFAVISTATAARSQAPLGVTAELFLQLVAGRVYMAALWGRSSLPAQQQMLLLLAMAIFGTVIVAYSLLKAKVELRLLTTFCFVIFALSMLHPMASYVEPQWRVLSTAAGQHYWFLPMLAFVWCLLWCALNAAPGFAQKLAWTLLATMPLGIVKDWRYPPYEDMHYATYVQQFAGAPEGSSIPIPIFPRGWQMILIRNSSACPVYPEGVIDAPKDGSVVAGIVQVAGWAIAPGRHVQVVSVKLDHQLVKSFRAQMPRPDVDRVHPDSADKNKGWQTELDSSKLSPGRHEIEVWAQEASGCAAEIAHVAIERAN